MYGRGEGKVILWKKDGALGDMFPTAGLTSRFIPVSFGISPVCRERSRKEYWFGLAFGSIAQVLSGLG